MRPYSDLRHTETNKIVSGPLHPDRTSKVRLLVLFLRSPSPSSSPSVLPQVALTILPGTYDPLLPFTKPRKLKETCVKRPPYTQTEKARLGSSSCSSLGIHHPPPLPRPSPWSSSLHPDRKSNVRLLLVLFHRSPSSSSSPSVLPLVLLVLSNQLHDAPCQPLES